MSRRVHLVLCTSSGEVIGELPTFTVDDPWWPEAQPVMEAASEAFGIEVIVLRLLHVESSTYHGGDVTYLAQLVGQRPRGLPLAPTTERIGDEPLRAAWARPGGVEATIAWADGALLAIGRPRIAPVVQVKTWNLSSILRLPTAAEDVWCKSVPPFFAHEGAIIALVAADEPGLVPALLASDPSTGTVLLDDVPGDDDREAPPERLDTMVRSLVRLQARWIDRVDALLAAGLPDWRARALTGLIEALLARPGVRAHLEDDERRSLDALTEGLSQRFAALEACGLADTLVHGDFHRGNWRFDGRSLVMLDWGDTGVGHPMLDLSPLKEDLSDEAWAHVRATWVEAWHGERSGADPSRAAELIAPIALLRQAVMYQGFLDGIEPSEHRYHASDVPDRLRAAIRARGRR